MKTFSQLKKDLHEGVIVKTINNFIKPERNGQTRKIGKVQTNAIAFEIPLNEQKEDFRGITQTLSWLWWDKANCYDYEGNIFKVYHYTKDNERVLDFIYEILEG